MAGGAAVVRRTRGVKKLHRRFVMHSRGRADSDTFAALLTSLRMKTGARYHCALLAHDEPGDNLYISVACFGSKTEFQLLMDSLCFALHALTAHGSLTRAADPAQPEAVPSGAGAATGEASGGWECLFLAKVKPECSRDMILVQVDELLNLFCMNASLYDFENLLHRPRGPNEPRSMDPAFHCAVQRIDEGVCHYGSWDYMGNMPLKQLYMRTVATDHTVIGPGPVSSSYLWQMYEVPRLRNTNGGNPTGDHVLVQMPARNDGDMHGYFMAAFDHNTNMQYLTNIQTHVDSLRSFLLTLPRDEWGGVTSSSIAVAMEDLRRVENAVVVLQDMRDVHSMAVHFSSPTTFS